jgi:hypothetical protein
MGPALGVIAGPFRLFPAIFPAFPLPHRNGCLPCAERGANPDRGYCRKGAITASNSPAGMAPTLR